MEHELREESRQELRREIKNGNLAKVERIVDLHRRYKNIDFYEALCEAASHGQLDMIKIFINRGVHIFPEVVACAVSNGHIYAVKLLLQESDKLYGKDKFNYDEEIDFEALDKSGNSEMIECFNGRRFG